MILKKIKDKKDRILDKIHNGNTGKLVSLVIEKVFILGFIFLYLYLFHTGHFNNFISKNGNIYGYMGLTFLVCLLFVPKSKKNARKIGLWTIVYILALVMVVYAGDGTLSENALSKKQGIIKKFEREKGKSEEKYYEQKGLYGTLAKEYNSDKPTTEYEKPIPKSTIAFDEEQNVWYVANRIIVIFKEVTIHSEAVKFANAYNLKLVGEMPTINTFIYELPNTLTFKDLKKQKDLIGNVDLVNISDFEYAPLEAVNDLKAEGFDKVSDEKMKKSLEKYLNQEGVVEINNENYLKALEAIYKYPDFFVGKKIIMQGRAFTDENMKENQIGLGMWQMWCCALDKNLVGYLTKKSENVKMEKDKWYNVEGKIEKEMQKVQGATKESLEPIVVVEKAKEIEEPKENTVY